MMVQFCAKLGTRWLTRDCRSRAAFTVRAPRVNEAESHLWTATIENSLEITVLTQPKALTVIYQQFECSTATVTEDENGPLQGIKLKQTTTDATKPIYTFAKVDRFNSHQYTHLRSKLDHGCTPKNVCPRATRSTD